MVFPEPRAIAAAQLGGQVLPLVDELATGFRQAAIERLSLDDPSGVEAIASRRSFPMDTAQISGDRRDRILERAESPELRMIAVPASTPAQDRLRQERLPPEGDQSGGVEVPRMESPEPH